MSPLHQKGIEHFTHPNHQLFEISNNNEYLCDGCKTLGTGKRFRCHGCDFDLHEYCGTCPMALSSFMHSQHQLNLVQRKSQATRQNERICDVCSDSIEGLFYRCKLCEFDVHPVCTQLPQQVRHVLDRAHPLTLQPCSSSCCCAVCRNECTSWLYRCGICRVDIHLECLLTPCSSGSSGTSSTPPSRSIRQPAASPAAAAPPAFGAYNAYGVPSFSTSTYAYPYQAPSFGAYNYGYAVPSGFSPYNPMYHYHQQQPQQQAGGGGGGRFRRKMFKIVGNIALGVFTNVVFGV